MTSFEKRLLQGLVFLSFFPYPAVFHLGNTAGVELSDALSGLIILLSLPLILRARSTLACVILILPIYVSLGALAFFGLRGDVELAIRAAVAVTFSLLVLPASGSLMRKARTEWLITPVSVAICIHAVVGVWQYRAFPQGAFPLRAIFQNPSFHNLQDISTTYALYVSRPFGLFPEPSAMAASLGPWILFLLWYGLRPSTRGRTKALVGVVAGTLLILLSQSIYAVFLLPCAFFILLLHRRTSSRRISILELLAWAVAALGVVLFPILSAKRIDVSTNDSTQGRFSSLVLGMAEPFKNVVSFLFGIGPGQSANAVSAHASGVAAIYSVVVSAFAEGGLVAMVAMVFVWLMCFRGRPAGYRHVFLFAWLAGIAFTTSYISLGPVWLFLAMMLDLEIDGANSPRDTDAGTGWSGATPDVPGDDPAEGHPVEHRDIHAARWGTSDGGGTSSRSASSRV